MTEAPYIDKNAMQAMARAEGLEPPSMYRDGYPHANCGGCCVRQGQAGWALTLRVHPDRYAAMEAFENEMRGELGDVAMLRDRTGGETRPLTLATLRQRIESTPQQDALFDSYDFGGCGCLTEGLAA
jgi:hypothetical protein